MVCWYRIAQLLLRIGRGSDARAAGLLLVELCDPQSHDEGLELRSVVYWYMAAAPAHVLGGHPKVR